MASCTIERLDSTVSGHPPQLEVIVYLDGQPFPLRFAFAVESALACIVGNSKGATVRHAPHGKGPSPEVMEVAISNG